MRNLAAFFLVVLLAACGAPAAIPVAVPAPQQRAPDSAGYPPVALPPATDRSFTRQGAPRDALSGRPLVADYIVVDKSERLLIAYSRGRPIRAYRSIQFGDAPMGHKRFQGDERTPEGVYRIDRRNPQSRFHLSLGISYPNRKDRAFAAQYGRSPGGDIFIHGQPTGRPGRMRGDWTDGCIALTNEEIEELWQIVPDGTPIEIRP